MVTAAVAAGLYAFSYPLNHDVGLSLYLARAMLKGEVLYTTLIEVNPPLYVYLAMIPAWLASMLHLSAVRLMQGSILVLSFATIFWAGVLAGAGSSSRLRRLLVTIALAVPVLGLAGVDYGQREHLLVALTAPYLVLVARRELGAMPGRLSAVLAGLTAGIGFALKPHFIVLWLALELVFLVRSDSRLRSWLRTEAAAVQVVFVVYLAFVLLVHPEYLPLLREVGPRYADFWTVDGFGFLFGNRYFVLLAATVGAFFVCAPSRDLRPFIVTFLIPAAFGFLMAVGQGKGWLYHFYPALAWTVAAGILLLADFVATTYRDTSRATLGRSLAIVLLIAVGALSAGSLVTYHRALGEARTEYVTDQSRFLESNDLRSLFILSPSLATTFPLVNYVDADWASPFASLWWISALHGDESPDVVPVARDSMEIEFLDMLVSSLVRRPPDIILIDTAGIGRSAGGPFPYVAYLSQHPDFEALWNLYRDMGIRGPFELYLRVPLTSLPGPASPP
jgi:hypothetical protein